MALPPGRPCVNLMKPSARRCRLRTVWRSALSPFPTHASAPSLCTGGLRSSERTKNGTRTRFARSRRQCLVRAVSSEDVRLDVWLDVACLFKTRSEAQRACNGGKIEVNGQRARPNRQLRVGDELLISRPFGR